MKRLVMSLSLLVAAVSLAVGSTDAEARLWRRCCNGRAYGYRGGYAQTVNYGTQNSGGYAAQGTACSAAPAGTMNSANPNQPANTNAPPPPTETAPSPTAPSPGT